MGKVNTAITTDIEIEKVASCRVAPTSGNPNEKVKDERPRELPGQTIKVRTGCGALYITLNLLEGRPYELFARAGKAGGCAASQCEAIGRLISLAWRKGVTTEEVIDQLNEISCQQQNKKDPELANSCADGVAKAIEIAKPCTEGEKVMDGGNKEEHQHQEQVNSMDSGKVEVSRQSGFACKQCNCD